MPERMDTADRRSVPRRTASRLAAWGRKLLREARERRVGKPRVLVVMGSSRSGRDEIVRMLEAEGPFRRVHSNEFLTGLCRWYPNMSRAVERPLLNRANENALYHAHLLLERLLGGTGETTPLLTFEPGVNRTRHLYASVVLPVLFPQAVFLHVVRNPLTELAEWRAGGDAPGPTEFALAWVAPVREWFGFAMHSPGRYFALGRDPVLTTEPGELSDGEPILLEPGPRRREGAALGRLALRELGRSLDPIVSALARPRPPRPIVPAFHSESAVPVPDLDQPSREAILRVCGWEMILLRMATHREGRPYEAGIPLDRPRVHGLAR
jgi:hypothetical protein